jgi:urea transporter
MRLPHGTFSEHSGFFPAWLISIVIGLLLTVIVRQALVATGTASYLRPAGLAYLSLACLLIFATWLLVFES